MQGQATKYTHWNLMPLINGNGYAWVYAVNGQYPLYVCTDHNLNVTDVVLPKGAVEL